MAAFLLEPAMDNAPAYKHLLYHHNPQHCQVRPIVVAHCQCVYSHNSERQPGGMNPTLHQEFTSHLYPTTHQFTRTIAKAGMSGHSTFTDRATIKAFALILMLTSYTGLVNAQLGVGCYASGLTMAHVEAPILPGLSSPFHDTFMSQGACTTHCKASQYLYAITAGGTTCYCTNQRLPEGNRVDNSRCDQPCVGNPLETCGSAFPGTGASRVTDGGGVFVNVMVIPHVLPSFTSSPSLPEHSHRAVDDQYPETLPPSTSIPDPTVATTTTIAGVTVRPQPEIRNDAGGFKPSNEDTAETLRDGGNDTAEEKGIRSGYIASVRDPVEVY